ncbi:MAG: DMT family transporter [Paracoccaceae bacterium]|nr:DMT family transporter [Paracoccaceae bacterium]
MDVKAILMGLSFSLMWSSAFATARIIVAAAPPLHSLALRFFLAGVIAILIAKLMGQTWRLTKSQWRATLIFGLCQNALYLGLNFIAMQKIEASLAAIIASTMPLLVALLGWIFLREKLRPLAILGLLTGFFGVALIMSDRITTGVDIKGLILCVIAALALAIATLTMRGASGGGNLLMVVGLQMLVGSAILSVASWLWEPWFLVPSPALFWAFTYQIFIPGLTATLLWFALVARLGAVRASSFHFLNPFFGVLIATFLLGEAMHPRDIIGVAIIMLGIWAVQMARAAAQLAARTPE